MGLVACSGTSTAANSITTIGDKTKIVAGNKTFEVDKGFVFEVNQGSRKKVEQFYDPDFVKNSYAKQNNTVYRLVPGYGKLKVQRSFNEGFESGSNVRDLIGPEHNWTSMTIQGKASPDVQSYVKLRHDVLKGKDFEDNRLDPSNSKKHAGSKSLRAITKAASSGLSVNKASIDSELVYFTKGDDFWFSGWFYIEKGKPTSIIDLESTYMVQAPGIRVMLDDDLRPSVELKFAHKPTFNMASGKDYSMPTGKWVFVRLHIYLMDSDAGRVRLWMDDQKLIDQAGRTLTLFDAVYNSLQVGITAAPAAIETIMYVDDVRLSDVGL